ncbi:MAG: nicotinamidase [Thermoleophilia bacterium]|nr:nicotinamidase [Thermoleophilia bacterium]
MAGKGNADKERLIPIGSKDVLIVVDVQRDFCPGGSLPVPHGDQVVPVINQLAPLFKRWVYTRDWHPPNHISFSDTPEYKDGSWPRHCVQGTPGAAWHPDLEIPMNAILVSKGDNPGHEAYSAFQLENLDLAEFLRAHGVERVFVTGLAAEYCVKHTALDALAAGFAVYVISDAIRGITEESFRATLAELEQAGAVVVRSDQLSAN